MIANTYVVKPFGISEVKVIALKGEPGGPTQEQVNAAVEEYMDDHPEAQIPDGAVTTEKLASNAVAPYADNLVSSSYVSDSEPYLFRKTFAGVREDTEIVGGSVVFNQLCNAASVTVANGHKYFMKKGTAYSLGASTGTAITGLTSGSDMVIDLNLMFGSTVADYINSLEIATAGAGVAFFRSLFDKPYYAYNAGTLMSVNTSAHKMVGFNQWDEEWRNGYYNSTTGAFTSSNNFVANANPIPVLPNTQYYAAGANFALYAYDANKEFIGVITRANNNTFTTMPNCAFINFNRGSAYGKEYKNDICINISNPAKNGTYEPYKTHSYPLDSSLTLRGLLKLDGDSIYYDGDIYKADGTVERRYGVVDLGTLTWAKSGTIYFARLTTKENAQPNYVLTPRYQSIQDTAVNATSATNKLTSDMSIIASMGTSAPYIYVRDDAQTSETTLKASLNGVSLVYLLATPTTEQAEPYTELQICDPNGTEEYIDTRDVPIPVGHNTKYMRDLKKLLEGIPDAPSANGTYVLKATVSSSGVTYSWVEG